MWKRLEYENNVLQYFSLRYINYQNSGHDNQLNLIGRQQGLSKLNNAETFSKLKYFFSFNFFFQWHASHTVASDCLQQQTADGVGIRRYWFSDEIIWCIIKTVTDKSQGPVSRKPRKLFGPVKPFLDHRYLKTEKCIRLKLLVWRELLFILRICE